MAGGISTPASSPHPPEDQERPGIGELEKSRLQVRAAFRRERELRKQLVEARREIARLKGKR